MPESPAPAAPPWLEDLDPVLVARLRRPLDAAGIIPLSLVNRIVGWVRYFSGRLPLLDETARRHGRAGSLRAGDVPIVHARLVTPPQPVESVVVAPVVVERVVVQAMPKVSEAARESAAPAQLAVPVAHEKRPSALADSPRAALPSDLPLPRPSRPLQSREEQALLERGREPLRAEARVAPPAAVRASSVSTAKEQGPMAGPIETQRPRDTLPAVRPPAVAREERAPEQRVPMARPIVRPIETRVLRERLPRVRPLGREGASIPGASPPPQPRRITVPSIDRAASTPPQATERSPLPMVTPVARAAPDAAPPPMAALPHVRPGGARIAGEASHAGASSAGAAPESAPWAAGGAVRSGVVFPQGHVASGFVGHPRSAPEEPSPVAAPRVAAPVDVDALVDKVQRKLLRRLAAERERKGGLG
jgi:hypothetical protein